MTGEDDDDEALSWAGARDPSLYEAPDVRPAKPSRASSSRVSKPTMTSGTDDVDGDIADDEPAGMSSVVLVALGVLGGIYALYTVGWFVSWQRLLYTDSDALELAAFHIQQALAVLAAPLWFVVTLLFTRGRRASVRLLILLIGAVVLVPWSFTFGQ